jgi:hypothetical protein
MDYNKLFGNATKFLNDYRTNYQGNRPLVSFTGQFLFPGKDKTAEAKYLILHEPKTKDLIWLSEIFPNIEFLHIMKTRRNYVSKLENINEIKNLKKLHRLHISDVFIESIEVDMSKIEYLELTCQEDKMINVTLTNPTEKIDFYRIVGVSKENDGSQLDNKSGNLTVKNLSFLKDVNKGNIYLKNVMDEDFNFIKYVNDLDEFKNMT